MEPEPEKKEENVPDLSFGDNEPEAVAAPPPPQPQDTIADLLGLDVDTPQAQPAAVAAPPSQPAQAYGGMDDLLGEFFVVSAIESSCKRVFVVCLFVFYFL